MNDLNSVYYFCHLEGFNQLYNDSIHSQIASTVAHESEVQKT